MDFRLLKGFWSLVTTLRENFNGRESDLGGAGCSDNTIPTHSSRGHFQTHQLEEELSASRGVKSMETSQDS